MITLVICGLVLLAIIIGWNAIDKKRVAKIEADDKAFREARAAQLAATTNATITDVTVTKVAATPTKPVLKRGSATGTTAAKKTSTSKASKIGSSRSSYDGDDDSISRSWASTGSSYYDSSPSYSSYSSSDSYSSSGSCSSSSSSDSGGGGGSCD